MQFHSYFCFSAVRFHQFRGVRSANVKNRKGCELLKMRPGSMKISNRNERENKGREIMAIFEMKGWSSRMGNPRVMILATFLSCVHLHCVLHCMVFLEVPREIPKSKRKVFICNWEQETDRKLNCRIGGSPFQ